MPKDAILDCTGLDGSHSPEIPSVFSAISVDQANSPEFEQDFANFLPQFDLVAQGNALKPARTRKPNKLYSYPPCPALEVAVLENKVAWIAADLRLCQNNIDNATSQQARTNAIKRKVRLHKNLEIVLQQISLLKNSTESILESQPEPRQLDTQQPEPQLALQNRKTNERLEKRIQEVLEKIEKEQKIYTAASVGPERDTASKKVSWLKKNLLKLQSEALNNNKPISKTEFSEIELEKIIAEFTKELEDLDTQFEDTPIGHARNLISKKRSELKKKLIPYAKELEMLHLKEKVQTLETALEIEKQKNALLEQNLGFLESFEIDLSGVQLGKRVERP